MSSRWTLLETQDLIIFSSVGGKLRVRVCPALFPLETPLEALEALSIEAL